MSSTKQLVIFIIAMGLISCNTKTTVDLIVTNATVYTVDEAFSKVESFAVKDGIIIWTGDSDEVDSKYTAATRIDADGNFVYPGFNDAHCHFNGYGNNLMRYADLSGTESVEEIYEILKAHDKKYGGKWVLGRGWDQNDWEVKAFPDKSGLDEIFPEIPVYLIRIDGHAAWCNSRALEIAGISVETRVEGGDVLLKGGEPSGILIDNAEGVVAKHIPEISKEQQEKGLLAAQENCFAVGLTSVTDCGVDRNTIDLMDELHQSGKLKMRINAMLNPTDENFEHFVKRGVIKTDQLRVNTIKLYADGALGSRGALMLEEYTDDPGNLGLQIASQDYFKEICELAYSSGFVVATHCIGDSANRLILDTYGEILKGRNDRRWRIEHAQVIHPNDFQKFKSYSIVPSIQATHCTSDMSWVEDRIGPKRISGAYAYKTLLHQLGWIPNGTDFPVEQINPLYTFYSSVFRTNHENHPDGGWQPEEGLSREEAIRSMTTWAARSSFEEKEKGCLTPGMWADFVLLDTDLIHANPQEVLKAKVLSTWSGGERVY